MKVDPTMCMKTKTRMTILPTQKTAFLHSCTPFYKETPYFAETVGSLVLFWALGNELLAPKHENTRLDLQVGTCRAAQTSTDFSSDACKGERHGML